MNDFPNNNGRPNKEIGCDVSVEEGIISSLTELRDTLKNGEKVECKYTMRTVDLELEPQSYGPEQVKQTREQFGASQAVFAQLLGVKVKTVQSWEQGLIPPRMARRLLDLMNSNPDSWRDILKKATRERVG